MSKLLSDMRWHCTKVPNAHPPVDGKPIRVVFPRELAGYFERPEEVFKRENVRPVSVEDFQAALERGEAPPTHCYVLGFLDSRFTDKAHPGRTRIAFLVMPRSGEKIPDLNWRTRFLDRKFSNLWGFAVVDA